MNSPLCIVIRMPNVTLSRFDLEKALGAPIDRYERASDGALGYAQIDIAEEQDEWGAALNCINCRRRSATGL